MCNHTDFGGRKQNTDFGGHASTSRRQSKGDLYASTPTSEIKENRMRTHNDDMVATITYIIATQKTRGGT